MVFRDARRVTATTAYSAWHPCAMTAVEDHYEAFVTAVVDPYLGALLGTIDEPGGTSTANRASMLTLAWWNERGTGPTRAELIDAVFEIDDWEAAIPDSGRTRFDHIEQLELLQRWLISYWTRLGAISYLPGLDEVVRPGRVEATAVAVTSTAE